MKKAVSLFGNMIFGLKIGINSLTTKNRQIYLLIDSTRVKEKHLLQISSKKKVVIENFTEPE